MSTRGILLVNTGTPESPTPGAIKAYLERFLADKRIVSLPSAFWKPIMHGFVLPRRPHKTVAAYRHIWTPEGSPYTLHSRNIERKLKRRTADTAALCAGVASEPPLVRLAHRYAEPSIETTLKLYRDHEVAEIVVLPQYPQQAWATTESVRDELARVLGALCYDPHVEFISDYHTHALYIEALAARVKAHVPCHADPERTRLVFSFHSTPLKNRSSGDPYFEQTQASARHIAEAAGLAPTLWEVAYQSRFADTQKWLSPFLEDRLKALLTQGVREFFVMAPGFAVDNLETLYEIEYKATEFVRAQAATLGIAANEVTFTYIPALNSSDEHIELLAALVGA